MKKNVVKARVHYGADSLDLTIPAEVCRQYGINEGDVFVLELEETEEDIALLYKRIFRSED
jgi:ribosomal protein S15P/S13E